MIVKHLKGVLAVCLIIGLMLPTTLPMQPRMAQAQAMEYASDYLDKIVFGHTESEQEHHFSGEFTDVIEGGLRESARVSLPQTPEDIQGGVLTFTMKVDPVAQNYFTMKFWGSDESSYKTMLYINGEQIGYRRIGDYQVIDFGVSKGLPDRFYYNTTMLPLDSTYGQETVQISVRTFSGNFGNKVDTPSRGYYNAYTHTQAYLNVSDETQGQKMGDADPLPGDDLSDEEKQAIIDGYTQSQIELFNNYSNKVDSSAGGKLSIVRYQDELRFYANALHYDWSPAQSTEEKREALERIFKVIDNHTKDYYGDTRLVTWGGHQGDWGGYYGALGEALYIVEKLIKNDSIYGETEFNDFLDQPFITGTVDGEYSLAGVDWDGGELTRREAWERALKANFDFARSRLSYIYNQVLYTYEGAWEAHEGLRIIHSDFYEGKDRSHQILLEALGARPFLGEEVLVGPDNEELDLYHSLFYHDRTARFTEDYLQIVAKGLAKSKLDSDGNVVRRLPYGEHYTGITEAGLTRENGYVANYGEATNYLPEYFFKTLFNGTDEQLNDEILKLALKNLHARGYTRYASTDDEGNRIMRMQQVLDERNTVYPGNPGYGVRTSGKDGGKALLYASLEMHMAQNEQKYSGSDWEPYWKYAKETVGYAQQQLVDQQFFNYFSSATLANYKTDYQLADTYGYITETRANYDRFDCVVAGVVLPQTDFDYYTTEETTGLEVNPEDYGQFAWADIDNMFISMRDGDLRLLANLNELNKGFSGNGRLHVINENYDNIVQIATNAQFQYEDYWMRMDNKDMIFFEDQLTNGADAPQALAGEIIPITYQPGVGKTDRDNFEADTPYAGYPDLLTARYGKYLMIFNTTRDVYGNEQSFEVELPADYKGSTVLDLVSGNHIRVKKGKVTASPKSAMVLKLTSDIEKDPKPNAVNFVSALAGNNYAGITWKTAAGAESYTILRANKENGKYEAIATGVEGNYYLDTKAKNNNEYFYKVIAVNKNGAGWESYRAKLDLTQPVTKEKGKTKWRDDRIGDIKAGSAQINDSIIAIQGANGTGLGEGDDLIIYDRDIHDSLYFVNQVTSGSSSISAKIESHHGAESGIMLRDLLQSSARYIYFGADEGGNLILQNRTRDSRHAFSEEKKSPMNAKLIGFRADEFPYVKLVRDGESHFIHAYVSKDGEDWIMVKKMFTPFPNAIYAGVVAAEQAQFSEVNVEEVEHGKLYPYLQRVKSGISLSWNKPKQALSFSLYRTYDKEASLSDPVLKEGSTEPEENSPWTRIVADKMDMSFIDSEPGAEDSPSYKVVARYLDGKLGEFSDAVYPPDETAQPSASNIKVTNNLAGVDDTIEVSDLSEGDVVKIYKTTTGFAVIGSAVAEGSAATVSIPQLGENSGIIYVTVTTPGKLESSRTAKSFPAENGQMHLQVEKDATLRFDSTAPGDFTWMTILSNGGNYETNKRYGIVTFDNVPDFDDENIESVSLRMYRYNGRTANIHAHHIEWDEWAEPGASGTLGAQLKSEYFNESSEAIADFFAGPSASAGIKPEDEFTQHDINASWNLDVTEILKRNDGNKATFLLSVPTGEANPATKEYVSGTSKLGQYGPALIVKYKTDNVTEPASESSIKVTNNPEGVDDTVEVGDLSPGDEVKVYRTATDTEVLGSAVAEESVATVSIPQIGVNSATLYVSVTSPGKLESERTAKLFAGEDKEIRLQVEKDATLRFNTTAPGDIDWLTILSNGEDYETNKRFGIITFDNVPDFQDEDIESVTIRLYRYNLRTATLRAHHIEWDDWVEPGFNGTLGAQLKSEYFDGSLEAIGDFFTGPYASSELTPEDEYIEHGVNASWNIDVTEILQANEGNKATFLLSVPSAEANPATKEYVSGTSKPGQYGPLLIIKYK